ncbi:hypothetical protein P4S72_24845 [Vibrio sp. PP-XX7]
MIKVHRDYLTRDKHHRRAHVEVNPVGYLDIDIIGRNECYHCDFEYIYFENSGEKTKVIGHEQGKNNKVWQLMLSDQDARELTHLIEEANETYELLMKDL